MLNFKIILVYVIISPPAPPEGLRVRPPRYLPVLILDFHGAPFGGTCAGDDGEHERHRPNDEHAVGLLGHGGVPPRMRSTATESR